MRKKDYLNTYIISVPYSIPLTKESAWNCIDSKKTNFFIARLHFYLRERIVEDLTKMGPPLSVFTFPKGVEYKKLTSMEIEHEQIEYIGSIEKSITESEYVQKFASNLLNVTIKSPFMKVDSSTKLDFTDTFRENFSKEVMINKSIKKKIITKVEDSFTFNENYNDKTYLVPEYQKRAFDIWLGYVDYLYVIYATSHFGLRKKRRKYPPYSVSNRTLNILKLNNPMGTINFWKKISGYSYYSESEYKLEVPDTNTFILASPENKSKHAISFPKLPSLYQVSNITFPLKWIKRIGNWTEKELMEIEEEEARDSVWWYMYGPGKNSW